MVPLSVTAQVVYQLHTAKDGAGADPVRSPAALLLLGAEGRNRSATGNHPAWTRARSPTYRVELIDLHILQLFV